MSVEWIEHKGKRILSIDHRGLEPDALIENAERAAKMVREIPLEEKILFLNNIEDALINTVVMSRLKKLGREVFEPRTGKRAVVGVRGVRHILVASYNRFTGAGATQKLFDSQEEALDWLVS